MNNKEFLNSKITIVKAIKQIYSQIIAEISQVVEDIDSEKLTDNLATSIEFLKEIKQNKKDKFISQLIYN